MLHRKTKTADKINWFAYYFLYNPLEHVSINKFDAQKLKFRNGRESFINIPGTKCRRFLLLNNIYVVLFIKSIIVFYT